MPGRYAPASTAPLVAAWDRWRKGFAPPPSSPAGDIPGTRKVELFIAEQWVDITRLDANTAGVYYRDNITITRGKSDEAATLDRGTCRFTLNNRDGRFSPRNPNSPYYGKIGRNTPVRVSVVQANGVRRYRFYGEVSSWPTKWDQSGTDVYVQVEASGILRRLGQGASPLSSAMYRGCSLDVDHLVAYWPCEDAVSATQIASATSGVPAMTISGGAVLASDSTTFVCSDALPVMGTASFTGYPPNYTNSLDQAQVRFLMSYPAAGGTNGQVICSVFMSGSMAHWELYYGSGGSLGLRGYDFNDTLSCDTGAVAFAVNGSPVRVSLEFTRSAAGIITATIATLAVGAVGGGGTSVTQSGSIGRITRVVMATNKGLSTVVLGHVTVQSKVTTLFDLSSQLNAWAGEHAGPRIARLCAEEGINFARYQPQSTSTAMGYQLATTLTTLIQAAVDCDMGRLSEPRDQIGFAYRDRDSLTDQTARLTLDYSLAQLADSLDPVDDDTYTRNDVTVTRDNGGSSVRVTKTTGALSTTAIGKYTDAVTLNVYSDAYLTDIAGWRLHLGTTDEARYPQIQLRLHHPTFTTSESMTTSALVLDIGDRVAITNPPAWLPPDALSLLVEGYTEVIGGNGQHTLTLNCSPESPYHVPIYDDATYRYSSDGSTLTSAIDETTISVFVDTPSGPVWTSGLQSPRIEIIVGGERMSVGNIFGSTSPQQFIATRSVNGIVKAHAAGEAVELFQPGYYAI